MRKLILLSTVLFIAISPVLQAGAGEEPLPAVVVEGLKAYKESGPEAALKAWIKGGPMEKKEKESLQYGASFTAIEEFYGHYRSYHRIETKELTPISRLYALSMDYERGPVFARFFAYKGEKDWILVSFDFNTKPEAIIPGLILR